MPTPRKRPITRARPLALGYVRVSTADQVDNGASLDAQRTALTGEADRRDWDLELVADEGLSGKNMNRPALLEALVRLDRGEADTLISIRLDRISRSVADFAGLLDRAGRKGWGLVLLSPALDLADPAGRFTANVLASAAQYERELISARTKEGMAQRKVDGWAGGRPAGRPRCSTRPSAAESSLRTPPAKGGQPSPATSTRPRCPPPAAAAYGIPRPSEQHSQAQIRGSSDLVGAGRLVMTDRGRVGD